MKDNTKEVASIFDRLIRERDSANARIAELEAMLKPSEDAEALYKLIINTRSYPEGKVTITKITKAEKRTREMRIALINSYVNAKIEEAEKDIKKRLAKELYRQFLECDPTYANDNDTKICNKVVLKIGKELLDTDFNHEQLW